MFLFLFLLVLFLNTQWTPEGRRLVTGASSGEFTLWNGLTFNFETILQVSHPICRAILPVNNPTQDHKLI